MTRRSLAFLVVFACRREEREPEPEWQPAPKQSSPEVRARALIGTLERGDVAPLAALITHATTWDGVTATGGKAGNSTTRAEIEMAGAAARDLVGAFRRIAFVWTERDYVYVLTEHASGDFVYMVSFDDTGHLGHLTFAPPHDLPSSSSCSPGAMRLFDDGSNSGRSVIDSSHIAPSVVEQVSTRVRSTP